MDKVNIPSMSSVSSVASRSFSFAACIFDMDDLLVDTSRVWIAAEERLLARIGRQRTAEVAVRWNGMNATDIARVIHELYRPPWPLAEFQGLLRQELSTAYRSGPEMPALRGAVELVRALSGRFPLAVASGSPPEGIAIALARLNIREHFAVLISSEEVPAGKPAPDVFLAAAARLKVEPARCVVFEDSLAGARAARAAGMACFTVPSAEHDKVAALSTRVLRSLDEAIPLLKPQA